jgi:UDP-N-acetylmuramate--alanine ligase
MAPKDSAGHSSFHLGELFRVHFIGVADPGMGGMAALLAAKKCSVSGSHDGAGKDDPVHRLSDQGIHLHAEYDASWVDNAQLVVVSNRIFLEKEENQEFKQARMKGIPVLTYARMWDVVLGQSWYSCSVAVTGVVGKSMTVDLVTRFLRDLDPTVVCDDTEEPFEYPFRQGRDEVLLFELPEEDKDFGKVSPTIGVVTSVGEAHLAGYKDFDEQVKSYRSFASLCDLLVACVDDDTVNREIVDGLRDKDGKGCPLTYGFSTGEVRGHRTRDGEKQYLDIIFNGQSFGTFRVVFLGDRLAAVALGAVACSIAVIKHLQPQVQDQVVIKKLQDPVAKALRHWKGLPYRVERSGVVHGRTVWLNIAEFPEQIRSGLQAVRETGSRRTGLVFWPRAPSDIAYRSSEKKQTKFTEALEGASTVVIVADRRNSRAVFELRDLVRRSGSTSVHVAVAPLPKQGLLVSEVGVSDGNRRAGDRPLLKQGLLERTDAILLCDASRKHFREMQGALPLAVSRKRPDEPSDPYPLPRFAWLRWLILVLAAGSSFFSFAPLQRGIGVSETQHLLGVLATGYAALLGIYVAATLVFLQLSLRHYGSVMAPLLVLSNPWARASVYASTTVVLVALLALVQRGYVWQWLMVVISLNFALFAVVAGMFFVDSLIGNLGHYHPSRRLIVAALRDDGWAQRHAIHAYSEMVGSRNWRTRCEVFFDEVERTLLRPWQDPRRTDVAERIAGLLRSPLPKGHFLERVAERLTNLSLSILVEHPGTAWILLEVVWEMDHEWTERRLKLEWRSLWPEWSSEKRTERPPDCPTPYCRLAAAELLLFIHLYGGSRREGQIAPPGLCTPPLLDASGAVKFFIDRMTVPTHLQERLARLETESQSYRRPHGTSTRRAPFHNGSLVMGQVSSASRRALVPPRRTPTGEA